MAKFWTSTQQPVALWVTDRKSTRLNSSHGYISYAVFCLKKKNLHIHAGIERCSIAVVDVLVLVADREPASVAVHDLDAAAEITREVATRAAGQRHMYVAV